MIRIFATLVFVALAASGCQKTSSYASKSKFSSVHTAGYGGSFLRPAKVFPDGLKRPALDSKRPYFIEFRARNALSYGHASVAFGKLAKNGKPPAKKNGDLIPNRVEISGLHPASDVTAVYSAGHFVPVLASTGPSDGDHEQAYLLARYRINLSKAEFDKVVAIVKKRKSGTQYWNGPLNSCVTYIRRIAEDMGLKTPATRHLPQGFVRKLKRINS